MEEYQKRVVEERNQLKEKIDKLNDFIKCPKFIDLSFLDRQMLVCQQQVMSAYFSVLELRIDSF